MATMLKVKLGVLILVVGAAAGNSSLCNYEYTIRTGEKSGAGTDAYVFVGLYDKDGQGWRHSFSGKRSQFEIGKHFRFNTTSGRECIDPCRVTLSISGGSSGSAWYPSFVGIRVFDEGVVDYQKYFYFFEVNEWVYEGYPIERRLGQCIYRSSS